MNEKRSVIACIGGAFDPPHHGHMALVATLLNHGYADEVWIIPSGTRSDKVCEATTAQRLMMCELMVATSLQGLPVRIERADADGKLPSEGTAILLEFLGTRHHDIDFRFVIGADLVSQLPTWRNQEKLRARGNFLVVPRPGFPDSFETAFTHSVLQPAHAPNLQISSTQIRSLLRDQHSVAGLIPTSVQHYISAYGLYGSKPPRGDAPLYRGRYLTLLDRNGWEMVERHSCDGIVAVIAVTKNDELVVVEQFRPAVGKRVIEIPAGLVGDGGKSAQNAESFESAAKRELFEETGYLAHELQWVFRGPPSAGLSSELIEFYLCQAPEALGPGGGTEGEDITVHHLPLTRAESWLKEKEAKGILIDPKVPMALWFCAQHQFRR